MKDKYEDDASEKLTSPDCSPVSTVTEISDQVDFVENSNPRESDFILFGSTGATETISSREYLAQVAPKQAPCIVVGDTSFNDLESCQGEYFSIGLSNVPC